MSTDQKEEGKRLSELNIDNNMCSSCLIFRQYNNYQYICMLIGLGLCCLTPHSTIFQYIVAVSFIGGEDPCTRRSLSRNKIFSFQIINNLTMK